MSSGRWIPFAMIAAAFAFSCGGKEKQAKAPEQTMYPAALEEQTMENAEMAGVPSLIAAPEQLASARCDREASCNRIGAGKSYPSKEACLVAVKAEWQDQLSTRECPKGINGAELTQCLQEIGNQDCNAPFSSLEHLLECNASDICVD